MVHWPAVLDRRKRDLFPYDGCNRRQQVVVKDKVKEAFALCVHGIQGEAEGDDVGLDHLQYTPVRQ